MVTQNAASSSPRRRVLWWIVLACHFILTHSIANFRAINVLNQKKKRCGTTSGAGNNNSPDQSKVAASSTVAADEPPLDDVVDQETFESEAEDEAPNDGEVFNGLDATTTTASSSSSSTGTDDVQIGFLPQPLDHFNETQVPDGATLLQRFFFSMRYVDEDKADDAPSYAFLCVGGEGPSLDESVLIDSVHCSGDMLELAKILHEEHGANVYLFALEHRYYGVSYPVFVTPYHGGEDASPVTNEHLVFLSSKQAQQDLSRFVAFHDEQTVPASTKWVTFGGSYPGFMAGWARQLFPTQIHAAVSSSAPIQIQVHFPGYKEHQAWDMQYDVVGGRQECLQVVMDGHAAIADALEQPEQHRVVADLFGLCDPDALLVQDNVDLFLGDGVIDIPAQTNDPSCQDITCNIEKVCGMLMDLTLVNGLSAMEALAKVGTLQRQIWNGGETDDDFVEDCLVVDWNGTLEYLASDEAQEEGTRSWLWQTCTEVGYYQTCPMDSLCPFGRGHHLLWMDYEICEVAYGINETQVQANVAATREHYSQTRLQTTGSRILSVQGDVDPWSVLSIAAGDEGKMPLHWVKGASHHFWTHPSLITDTQPVKDARDLIYLKIMEWLRQDPDTEDNNNNDNNNNDGNNDVNNERTSVLRQDEEESLKSQYEKI